MKDLTVVIPIYNEEKNIAETIMEVAKHVPDASIIAVDDCSRDKSPEVLSSIKNKYNLTIIRHEANRGYGGALKTGFEGAKTEYVSFLDADLTYPPEYLPEMLKLAKKEGLDCVWGDRHSGKICGMPLSRKIGNKMLLYFFFIVSGRNVYDCCSGERVITKSGLEKISYKTLPNGLDFITAMTKRIVARKLKFKVIPINYYKRGGASKLNAVKDFFRMARNILIEK